MSSFTIIKVNPEPRVWSPKDEPDKVFRYWDVEFKGDQGEGTASWKTQPGEPAPKEGDTVDAEIVQKNGKTELKAIRKGGFGARGGGGKSPQERAEIRRMAAQKAAVETFRAYVDLAIAAGKAEEFRGKQPREILDPLIAYFDGDCKAAGERAS